MNASPCTESACRARTRASPAVCDAIWHVLFRLTSLLTVLAALLDEHERLMFDLLRKIEEKRNEIEVRALEEDLNEIDPDDVVKEM